MTFRRLAAVAFVASLYGTGVANAIEYYNLTQLNPDGTLASPNAPPYLNATAPVINQAIFTTDPTKYPDGFGRIVGTGVIDPFLRIHRPNANCAGNDPCPEYGYNTSGDGSKAQEFPGGLGAKEREGHNWNHTLVLDSIGKVKREDGLFYRVFALDINEPKALGSRDDYLLSLDQFRLFASDKDFLDVYSCGTVGPNNVARDCDSSKDHGLAVPESSYNPNDHTLGWTDGINTFSAMKIFDLDTSDACSPATDPDLTKGVGSGKCDRTLGLNSEWTSGSGNGVDMVVYVPDALFDESKPYIYLFSSFGELGTNDSSKNGPNSPADKLPAGDFGQAGGFEEWYTLKAVAPISPTLALFGLGLVLMTTMRKMKPMPQLA